MLVFLLMMAFQSPTKVLTVQNGLTPESGLRRLVLSEDLRFGGKGDGYVWQGGSSNLAVNKAGEMFLADTGVSRILRFDAKGAFLGVVASSGKLPGQVQGLDNIAILANGQLVAMESQPGEPARFQFFDAQGQFLRTVNPVEAKVLRSCVFDPQGKGLAGTWLKLLPDGTVETRMGFWDQDLKLREIMFERRDEFKPEKFSDRAYLLEYLARLVDLTFAPKALFAFDPEGRLWTAQSDRYQITRRAQAGSQDLVLEKQFAPIENDATHIANIARPLVSMFRESNEGKSLITREFVGEMMNKTHLPEHKLPLFGLIPMEDGGLLAVHDINLESGSQLANVFNAKGQYIGDLRMENQALIDTSDEVRMLFRNGYAYTLENKAGTLNIVRYKPHFE